MLFEHSNVLKVHNKMLKCNSIKNGYKIPNIIHQTFCSKILPLEIANNIKLNKQVCKKCQFIFYDDLDCELLIKNNFNDEIYNTYKKINPSYGAMRADFFRYCVLYLYGGIYLDIKSKINYPIFKIINKNDICILDIPRSHLEPWRTNSPTYEQWLLIFSPRHPYLLSIINQMYKDINNKYIPEIINGVPLSTKGKILHITGPDAFTRAVNNFIQNNNKILHRNIDYNKFFSLNTGVNYINMYNINNKKHYSEIREPLFI
jgi:mannosyltransferase OCH1-like enzyme